MAGPPLTVCVSAYNEEARIAACLTHLAQQTFKDFRIVVLDNASTDRTVEIAERFAATEPRVSVRRNLVNVGPIQNFQRCYWLADTPYVMQASANDTVAPTYIERLMAALTADPGLGVAYSQLTAENRIAHYFEARQANPVERATTVMAEFMSGHVLYGIFRRDVIDACAPLAYRMGADHIFVAEAALYGGIACVAEELYRRTPHPGRTPQGNAKLMSDYGYRLTDAPPPFETDLGVLPPYVDMIAAHVEMFDRARIAAADREELKRRAVTILAGRFQGALLDEIKELMQHAAAFSAHVAAHGLTPGGRRHGLALTRALAVAQTAVPEVKPYLFTLNRALAQLLNESP